MAPVEQLSGTTVQTHRIVFRCPDPEHRVDGVRLWTDLDLGVDPQMRRTDAGWELRVPMPRLDCLEYLFEVAGAGRGWSPTPATPRSRTARSGRTRSWRCPATAEPRWLDLEPVAGRPPRGRGRTPSSGSPSVGRRATTGCRCWSPTTGPEIDAVRRADARTSRRWSARASCRRCGWRCWRPGPRDERYAANPAYPAMLGAHGGVHGCCGGSRATTGRCSAARASARSPRCTPRGPSRTSFGGLFLQSGSFFTPELDPQESGFSRFAEVTGFVAAVHAAGRAPPGLPPIAMTCGTRRGEPRPTTRRCAPTSSGSASTSSWGEVRQGHTWTCWRDLFDPHLTRLLQKVWS